MTVKRHDENDREPGRAADGEASFYFSETDGYWHGRVIVGTRDDGTPGWRHCRSKDKKKALEKFQALKKMRDAGTVRKPDMAPTVKDWLTHWVENIAAPSVRYKTLIGYRSAVYRHLIPGLGAHRIDKVQPEHFEKLYMKIIGSGRKPATAHQVHASRARLLERRTGAGSSCATRLSWPSRRAWRKTRSSRTRSTKSSGSSR